MQFNIHVRYFWYRKNVAKSWWFITSRAEVGTRGATILLAIALAPQLFLNGCTDACTASILAILSAIAQAQVKIRLWMIVFQSSVIEVNKKTLTRYTGVARIFEWGGEAKLQITCNDVINIFREEGLFTEQRIKRIKRRIKSWAWVGM